MFSVDDIQRFQSLPTPFYYYDMALLRTTVQTALQEAARYGFHIHYALKANANDPILAVMREFGCGADCVSGNEILKASAVGLPQIVFAGVGKSDAEIRIALQQPIFCFNCESLPEIEVIDALAAELHTVAPIALRINPNVNAQTHQYITTGLEENKFGLNMWEMDAVMQRVRQLTHVRLIGIHCHIGSQITDLAVFKSLCLRVNELQTWFANKKIPLTHINVGGGLGIDYHTPDHHPLPDFAAFFALFHEFLALRPGQQVHFELGRALVGQCGSLISKVLFVKSGAQTRFVILDAGMTELIRPALYQAHHAIENLSQRANTAAHERYDVVGPICESADCFGKAVSLPPTTRGDLLAIRSTGAYGEVMSSQYNLREKAKAVYSE